jgi:predicted transposase YbfD/YdcC
LGVVLSEVSIPTGENELTKAEAVIEQICLKGVVITADALHTQKEFARRVLQQGGDYLFVVKANQEQMLEDIRYCFENREQIKETIRETREFDSHGARIEERHLLSTSVLKGYLEFPGAWQVMQITRFVKDKKSGEEREETQYAITSLSEERAHPAELLKIWREHWHIENKLHYVRDVTFGEDASPVRTGNLAQTMAALRNVAISGLRLLGFKNIAAGLRRCSAKPGLAFSGLGIYRE